MKRKQATFLAKVFRTSLLIVPTLFVFAVVQAQSLGDAEFGIVQFGGGAVGSVTTFPDGAVGAPSVAFTSAPTAGMWYTGGQIHFSTAGADRGYFSSVGVVTTNAFSMNALSYMSSPSSGVVKLSDTNDTSFNRLQLGGTTSSFPALKMVGAVLEARLADDSADAIFTSAHSELNSSGKFMWSSTASADGSSDTAITRSAAATIKVTDSSSGTGQILGRLINSVAAVPAEPIACAAGTFGVVAVVNDTNDAAVSHICYCGQQSNDTTYDWLKITDNTACAEF